MAFYRAAIGGGGSAPTGFTQVYSATTSTTTHTITGLTSRDVLLFAIYGGSGNKFVYNRYDGATCSGGTISKLGNLYNSGSTYAAGTFYQVKPTSTSVTITTTSGYARAYKVT